MLVPIFDRLDTLLVLRFLGAFFSLVHPLLVFCCLFFAFCLDLRPLSYLVFTFCLAVRPLLLLLVGGLFICRFRPYSRHCASFLPLCLLSYRLVMSCSL
ncbi:hypothetical protein K438DRAFT_1821560 [Mycena galopus ATCC 62051]|nr:hypothetical protein K438DRAFT_1821560 [Mycena galopus ATCC 62051]